MASSVTNPKPEAGSVLRIPLDDLAAHVATLEAELSRVQTIELTRGEAVVAEVRAPQQPVQVSGDKPKVEMPDFMARLRARWGDQPRDFNTTAWIEEEREDRL